MHDRRRVLGAMALVVAAVAGLPAAASADDARYALVHGCYDLAPAGGGPSTGPYRMQATRLGGYLLWTKDQKFLAGSSDGTVGPVDQPSPAVDFTVDGSKDDFTLTLPGVGGRALAAPGGKLALVDAAQAGHFAFTPAQGCPEYPEVEVDATGTPRGGEEPYSTTRGLIDAHMHLMAYEFLGGDAHCGRPWSPYGAPYALAGCSGPAQTAANFALDNALAKDGPGSYSDPVGWPTFKSWPQHGLLAHEMSYYKWLERAWMGGLRTYVNLLVDNEVLCKAYPVKRNPCNDMAAVRLQNRDLNDLQDYIDAQSGGPGKGWFRIVTDPFQAREVINEGKLAVIKGIEVSRLFECGVNNDVPDCDVGKIDRNLKEVYDLGVRDMELVNKFDNAFGGVAGDEGTTGQITGVGNKLATGKFYQMQHCPTDAQDRPPTSLDGGARDPLVSNAISAFLPAGTLPVYPPPPACNTRALTSLGEHLIRAMTARHMIVDPDHLDVVSRSQVLSILEASRYSGVISSHSWSDVQSLPRILGLGGMVTPYAGNSTTFVNTWREERKDRSAGPYYFGWGYGADANGFGPQGGPRVGATNPISYPFKSFDGSVTFDRQKSGVRVFDYTKEGVAHYGLYPDWIEDLRKIAGPDIINDMARGSEAYLQMWERADGVPLETCRVSRLRFTAQGTGFIDLGKTPEQTLRHGGQVLERPGRTWSYCVLGRHNTGKQVKAVFGDDARVALVTSTAPTHRAMGVGPGMAASKLRKHTRAFGPGLRVRSAGARGVKLVYGVRNGKVRFIASVTRRGGRTPATLRALLRRAGL